MFVAKVLLLFLVLIQNGFCAKILGIFPMPSHSHQILGSALLKELARRGHEVTMISPFPLKNPPKNYKDIFLEEGIKFKEEHSSRFMNLSKPVSERLSNFSTNMELLLTYTLRNNKVQELLNSNEKFDLVIQMWIFNEALLGIGHKLNAPTIGFSVVGGNPWVGYTTGNPNPYSYVPNMFLEYTDDMTFFQRVINTLSLLLLEIVHNFINLNFQQRVLHEFFPDAPPLQELIDNVDLILVNSHVVTESARPYLPNVIQIGGFHLHENETLPKDLKKFLDESKNGVIFFSLGTNIKSADLSQEKINAILKSFKNCKYDIMWKFEKDLPNKPKNVLIKTWLPQRVILQHPNVRGFISHGGLGSVIEAIYNGVPMICTPFFGDQQKNVADAVANGFAIHLSLHDINEENLTQAIKEITENPSYKKNIMIRSDLFKNQEINPMDRAVYWVEHVIKHKGAKHLKSRASTIPWYQYMLLDIIAFLSFILLMITLLTYLSYRVIRKIYTFFISLRLRNNVKKISRKKVKKN